MDIPVWLYLIAAILVVYAIYKAMQPSLLDLVKKILQVVMDTNHIVKENREKLDKIVSTIEKRT